MKKIGESKVPIPGEHENISQYQDPSQAHAKYTSTRIQLVIDKSKLHRKCASCGGTGHGSCIYPLNMKLG